jgi:hypothetical protein
VTGRKDRRGAFGLERMLASSRRTGSAKGLLFFSESASRCLSAVLRFLMQYKTIDSNAPTRSKTPIAIPAAAPPLTPPLDGEALLVEVELAADAVFAEGVAEKVRELVAARRGAEATSVVEGALISDGREVEDCTSAVLLASMAIPVKESMTDDGVCEAAGTTTGAFVADGVAARTAGAEVSGLSGAATPTVVYPPMGPSKVGAAVT